MARSVAIPRDPTTRSGLLWRSVVCGTVVLALIVGFFLHGGVHGLYTDDYTHKAWALSFLSGTRSLHQNLHIFRFRPLHFIVTGSLTPAIPDHEFLLRVGVVIVHVLNVFLVATLVGRLTGSGLTAVLSGGWFLMPVVANEALLWFSAAIPHAVGLVCLLLGFHAVLTCSSLRSNLLFLIGGVIAWMVMILFVESGLFTLLLLPVFMRLREHRGLAASYKISITALTLSYLLIGAYIIFALLGSWGIADRGGTTLNPAFILSNRIPDVFRQLVWLLTGGGVFGPLGEAMVLGLREWRSAPGGVIILAGLLLGLLLVAFTRPPDQGIASSPRRILMLAPVGLAWMVLALLPVLFLKAQPLSIRTLYTWWVGAALSMGGFLGWMVEIVGRWRQVAMRAVLLATGALVFASSLSMAGLVRTYQLRWELDRRQLAAFRAVIQALPRARPIWLLPIELDERTVSRYTDNGTQLDRYLAGVFELPWSTRDAIEMEYGVRDIQAVTPNRWTRLRVSALHPPEGGQGGMLTIQSMAIPVDRVVAFTYQDDRLTLLNPLELHVPNRDSSLVVRFPLTDEIARAGLATKPIRVELEAP